MGIEPFSALLEGFFDDKSEADHSACRLFDYCAKGLGGSASGEEVVDDEGAETGGQHSARNLNAIFRAACRRDDFTEERMAATGPEVLLGEDHGNLEVQSAGQRWGYAAGLGGEQQVGRGEGLDQIGADGGEQSRIDPVIEEIVDLEKIPLYPAVLTDGARSRSRPSVGVSSLSGKANGGYST